jgi:hypothetical protein
MLRTTPPKENMALTIIVTPAEISGPYSMEAPLLSSEFPSDRCISPPGGLRAVPAGLNQAGTALMLV